MIGLKIDLKEVKEPENVHEGKEAEKRFYSYATKDLLHSIGKDEVNRLFGYEECELEFDFVGFLYHYADLKELPKDFTIIDVGCYQAFQGDYFKDHKCYIGVEPCVPENYCLRQDNAVYYNKTGQQFIEEDLPVLLRNGLDLDKTFVICANVPDKEIRKIIADTFPNHRIWYTDQRISEHYPEGFEKGNYPAPQNPQKEEKKHKKADIERD